jgi:hypothetical protein
LPEIEQMIRDGATVEIVDSQTGKDLTRTLLVQIIAERHPDKIAVFPTAMLHSILRANDVVSDFLRQYFRNSLAYLDYFQQSSGSASFDQPMQWVQAWLDTWPKPPSANRAPKPHGQAAPPEHGEFAERIARLEQRIAELEAARSGPS